MITQNSDGFVMSGEVLKRGFLDNLTTYQDETQESVNQ